MAQELQNLSQRWNRPASTQQHDHRTHELGMLRFLQERLETLTSAEQAERIAQMARRNQVESLFGKRWHAAQAVSPVTESVRRRRIPPSSNLVGNDDDTHFDPVLEMQAAQLQKKFELDTEVLQEANAQLEGITGMLSSMSMMIDTQNEQIESIVANAEGAEMEVASAEKEFKKAEERGGRVQFWIMIWFVLASFILLVLDWLF